MSEDEPLKQAWQASAPETGTPDLTKTRGAANLFYRRIRRRNALEYTACIFVVLAGGYQALVLPSLLARIGAAALVLGATFVAWQLHRRGSAIAPPEGAGTYSILLHQRAELVRQRDAVASILHWYLLPLAPGMLLMRMGDIIQRGRSIGWVIGNMAVQFGLILLLFAVVWIVNRRGARRLQRQIDEIDALAGETK